MTKHTDEELIAIAKAATPGPWYQSGSPWFQTGGFVLAGSPDPHAGTVLADLTDTWETQRGDEGLDADHERDPDDDAKFIATFNPTFVLSLIERARTADEILRRCQARKPNETNLERIVRELTDACNEAVVDHIDEEVTRGEPLGNPEMEVSVGMVEAVLAALQAAEARARTAEEALRVEKCEHAETQAFHDEQPRQLTACQAERDAALSGQPAAPSLPADDVSSLIAARCSALPGKLINCPVCGAVDKERDRQEADVDLLMWLAEHRRLELDYGYDDQFEDMFWRVHEVSGGVNDREWDLIGQGSTPSAALLAAKSFLEESVADDA